MKYYIYRNHTIEHLFKNFEIEYSSYDDISHDPTLSEIDNFIWFFQFTPFNSNENLLKELNSFREKIDFLFDKENYNKNTIIIIPDLKLFSNLFEASDSFIHYSNFVNLIISLTTRKNNIKYVFLEDFSKSFSSDEFIDWKYYYYSDMIINPKLSVQFQKWFEWKLNSINFKRKKCLVLDCDNTIWGGIIGEDGLNGIHIGDGYPGKCYSDFQKVIFDLFNHGVILALCSKNNEEDVWDVFENNHNMILKKKHIAASKINWENKANNIIQLSKELNIGLDSIVFIDDNPLEREIVNKIIPDVVTPEFPKDSFLLHAFIAKISIEYFSAFRLTEEDKKKSEQYTNLIAINELKKNYENHFEYLIDLEMVLSFCNLNDNNILRIAQMTQKTNQFNLTTIRYNESDISQIANEGNFITCLKVSDKFGNHGITASSIILFQDAQTVEINSYLLSCRILGRGIEHVYLNVIINYLIEKGVTKIFAKYVPTKKNTQTENFYDTNHFQLVSIDADGTKKYYKDLKEKIKIANHFKIEYYDL
jgi:FkbH-like protein